MLPVPETIPFRLTRDIVHPMGVTEVDGVFKRCAQFVLQVMRDEQVRSCRQSADSDVCFDIFDGICNESLN